MIIFKFMKKVSIITPLYNSALYIQNTIASVQSQTLSDWEMIIVDDGSTDNSAEIVQKISISDSRIKLIQKENGGSASARNMGLSFATGKYIQFLDADDTISPDKLERQTTILEQENLDVIYSDFRIVNSDGTIRPTIKGYTFNLFRTLIGWGPLGTIPPHAFLYKHDFIQQNKINFTTEIREREDWDFLIKIFSAHPKSKRMNGYCGAYYFRCPTGKTTNGSLSKLKIGTIRYLLYKINHISFGKKIILFMRLSVEIVELIMRSIRKQLNCRQILPLFFSSPSNIVSFFCSLLFIPIGAILLVLQFITSRLH